MIYKYLAISVHICLFSVLTVHLFLDLPTSFSSIRSIVESMVLHCCEIIHSFLYVIQWFSKWLHRLWLRVLGIGENLVQFYIFNIIIYFNIVNQFTVQWTIYAQNWNSEPKSFQWQVLRCCVSFTGAQRGEVTLPTLVFIKSKSFETSFFINVTPTRYAPLRIF